MPRSGQPGLIGAFKLGIALGPGVNRYGDPLGTVHAAAEALGAPDQQLRYLTLLLGSAIAAPR